MPGTLKSSEDIMLGVLGESTRQHIKDVTSRVLEYIREKYSCWQHCSDEDLRSWLIWHWCHGLVAAVSDPLEGKICALVVARLLDEPIEYETAYLHKPKGSIIYVELAISEEPAAFRAAIDLLERRLGTPTHIMHERGAKERRIRLRSLRGHRSLLEKQNGSRSL